MGTSRTYQDKRYFRLSIIWKKNFFFFAENSATQTAAVALPSETLGKWEMLRKLTAFIDLASCFNFEVKMSSMQFCSFVVAYISWFTDIWGIHCFDMDRNEIVDWPHEFHMGFMQISSLILTLITRKFKIQFFQVQLILKFVEFDYKLIGEFPKLDRKLTKNWPKIDQKLTEFE